MIEKKNILVAPLNWGLGHATRCIPIINKLIANNYNVIIASSGRSLELLMIEFPKSDFIKITDYNIKYYKGLPLFISIIIQLPKLFFKIKSETKELDSIIKDFNIKGIISDNRFGLYSKKIKSIYLTHQLEIQSPMLKNFIQKINYHYINKFSECWILDYEKEGLAGDLSHPKKRIENQKYIGPQSRFEKKEMNFKYDILAIVSGPEPQRTIFESILIKELNKTNKKSLLVQGKPERDLHEVKNNLTIVSHLSSKELNEAILQSRFIISRSGYSTIMDLHKLGKNAILIPTPGQTEQEYLANYLAKKGEYKTQNQSNFNLDIALNQAEKFKEIKTPSKDLDWQKLFKIFEV